LGAGGRNAGNVTPIVSKNMPTAIMLYGKERTADLVCIGDHCVMPTRVSLDTNTASYIIKGTNDTIKEHQGYFSPKTQALGTFAGKRRAAP
jgi:hypothetical protein